MIFIKHRNDLSQIPESNPAYPILDDLCTRLIGNYPAYDPTHDGWLILAESDTLDFSRPLTEIWPDGTAEDSTLIALQFLWEGVTLEDGFYHAIYLANNQFGLYFLIPDCPELPDDVRESLEHSRID
jgi:hypothetical protein